MIATVIESASGLTTSETPPAPTGETVCVMLPQSYARDGTARGVIALHGRGADAFQPRVHTLSFGRITKALTSVGYIVASPDAGGANGGTAWSSNLPGYQAIDAVTALYNRLTRVGGSPKGYGAKSGKIGFTAWSMGCVLALNWANRFPANVAFLLLFAPPYHLDYFHGVYTAEMDAAFGGNYAANAGPYKPDGAGFLTGMGNIPVWLVHGDADTVVPPQDSLDLLNAWPAGTTGAVHQRTLLAGRDHTTLFTDVSDDDVREWARKGAWS